MTTSTANSRPCKERLLLLLREKAKRLATASLAEFVRQAWATLEPQTPLLWGWHLDALCAHLEGVSRGRLRDLVVTIPPGSGKSTIAAVCWPAWHWASDPAARFITASHSLGLALRDAVRSRRLIESPWYQGNWGRLFRLTGDQNTKGRYENDRTGYRVATSVDGGTTGERGHFTLIDDPHDAKGVQSQADRDAAALWHDEAFYNRVNETHGRPWGRVVLGQRTHSQDLQGHVIDQGWPELRLPEEFEAGEACSTPLPWSDPRTEDGEPLRPGQFPPERALAERERLGEYGYAAQHQMRPVPRSGGLFKKHSLERFGPPLGRDARRVRYWDKGYSSRGDFTAGVLMATDGRRYCVEDVSRVRLSPRDRNAHIKATAEADYHRNGRSHVRQVIEMPPGAGTETTETLLADLHGYVCQAVPARKSKEENAEPLSCAFDNGLVHLVAAPWNRAYVEELVIFPKGANDDQVDGSSGAYLYLCRPPSYAPVAGGAGPTAAPLPRGHAPPGRPGHHPRGGHPR